MKKELDSILVEKYPKIFADRHEDVGTTAMCWGFDCGDGWFWLIDQLCSSIQDYIDANEAPQVIATQVKEKYGELCFYYRGGNDLIEGMVWLAENLSGVICETCGATENVIKTKGWIKTICQTCLDKESNGN